MISQTDRDRELYESQLKMRRDISAALAEARQAGEAEGFRKAIEKRIENAIEKGRIDVQVGHIRDLQRILRLEVASVEALQAYSSADLKELAERLKNELSAKLANGA